MKISLSWSSGKDAALAYLLLQSSSAFELVHLHTTVNAENKRVGLHGTPQALVQAQAEAIGLPITFIEVPPAASNHAYETAMQNFCAQLKLANIGGIAYGDIFLKDLKIYREKKLRPTGLQPVFPLWGKDTNQLALEVLEAGIKPIICAADADLFTVDIVGRPYNWQFLANLPKRCDACGELGEFHTFVYQAPYFKNQINYQVGKPQMHEYTIGPDRPKKGFWFANLKPM